MRCGRKLNRNMSTSEEIQITVRDYCTQDFSVILDLNAQVIPEVSPMDTRQLEWFSEQATYFKGVESDGRLAGFLIAVDQDSGYDSKYFQWFHDRFERFLYIDRVIVALWARRNRLAWVMYEKVDHFAVENDYPLVSDVYSHPPNEPSLAFHQKFGFEQVGFQFVDGGTKTVAKLLKRA